MGSKDIAKVEKNKKENTKGIEMKNLKHYTGKKVALDVSVMHHRWKFDLEETNKYFLMRAAQWFQMLFQCNITLWAVYDGFKSPSFKIVQEERKVGIATKKQNWQEAVQKETVATEKLQELQVLKTTLEEEQKEIEEINKQIEEQTKVVNQSQEETKTRSRQYIRIMKSDYVLLQELCDLFGIGWAIGDEETEADFILATWARKSWVDVVFSNDSDIRGHGAPCVSFYYNENQYKKNKGKENKEENKEGGEKTENETWNPNSTMREFRIQEIISSLNLTMDQYVDIFILCHCDYCEGIKEVGPVKALEWIRKYKSVTNMLPVQALEWYLEAQTIKENLNKEVELYLKKEENVEELIFFMENEMKKDIKGKVEELERKAKEMWDACTTMPELIKKKRTLEEMSIFWKQYKMAKSKFGIDVSHPFPLPNSSASCWNWNLITLFFQTHLSISEADLQRYLPWIYDKCKQQENKGKKEDQIGTSIPEEEEETNLIKSPCKKKKDREGNEKPVILNELLF